MPNLQPPFRAATPDDAHAMTEIVNMAGEGLPVYLWSKTATGDETPWDIGRQRAQRESGAFSYRNTVVAEDAGRVVAGLIGYALPEVPEPIDYDEMPPMFVPMQELENLAPNTWYVNVLATYPEYRGKGFGAKLLAIAEQLAAEAGCEGMSIMVSDANTGARRLYERQGYVETASRPIVKESWENDGENWVLLVKTL